MAKYLKFYKKSYIDISKAAKWCPAPRCKYAVEYPSMRQADINCDCGNDFCFKCLRSAHRPIDCELLAQWVTRIKGDDNDTDIWIKLNTKHCPKCKVAI